jgi:hypothetical protein
VSAGEVVSLSIAGLSLVFAALVFYATSVRSAEIRLYPVEGNSYLAAGGLSNGVPSGPTITITMLASNLGATGGLLQVADVTDLRWFGPELWQMPPVRAAGQPEQSIHTPFPVVFPLAMQGGQTVTLFLVGHFRGGIGDGEEFRRQLAEVERLEAVVRWRYWRIKRPLRSLIGLAKDEHGAVWEQTTVDINVANFRDYVEKNSPPLDT